MTRVKTDTNQEDKRRLPGAALLASGAVLSGFVLVGFFLTVLAFLTVNGFVQKLVHKEYEAQTRSTVEMAVKELLELESSMKTLSSTLSMHEEIKRATLVDKARQSIQNIEHFDQIWWLYQPEPGQWQVANIYTQEVDDRVDKRYSIRANEKLLNYLVENKLFSSPDITVHTNLDFISEKAADDVRKDIKTSPLALIKTVQSNNLEAGVIIAVGSLAPTLVGIDQNAALRLNVREVETGYPLYGRDFDENSGDNVSRTAAGQAFDFMFAGSKWEIRTTFMPDEQFKLLRSLPFFVVAFSFMIIAFGALYIRSNTSRNIQISRMYRQLEDKNVELEAEVKKRTKLNEALSQSERENRSIIDAVSDIIFEVDTEGKILFLSAAWNKVTGFEIEQSNGLDLFTMLHSQDQETHRKDFELMVRGQKQDYRSFARLRTSDGTFRAVELAFSMIRQDKNNNLRVVGTITDVEERRRAERALSEAEKKYRAIVENAAGGIYQLTPEGLYLSANPAMARILGYDSPQDLLRHIKNANDSVYVDMKERQGFLRELERRGMINGYEVQITRKDGKKIWVNENIRVVKDEHNNTLYYEGSLEDITSRKESELAMRDAKVHSDLANRAKSEFLANMSHELRTPLNAIIGFSEMIKNEVFGPLEQRAYWEYAKDINQSGNNLLQIINEILDISKIEAGERQLNEGVIDLNEVVEGCLSLMSNKVETNNMTVTNTLQDVPHIVGEELAIKQVMMNLLSNAIKFTPSGGRVTISAELDQERQLRLSVTDTGVGLDETEIKKALSPFGQIDNELSRSGNGTGLGLTLVDALVKLHGGELELFSQKGIGTTATVIFPKDRVTVKKRVDNAPDTKENA